jgi:hypothetical protein
MKILAIVLFPSSGACQQAAKHCFQSRVVNRLLKPAGAPGQVARADKAQSPPQQRLPRPWHGGEPVAI